MMFGFVGRFYRRKALLLEEIEDFRYENEALYSENAALRGDLLCVDVEARKEVVREEEISALRLLVASQAKALAQWEESLLSAVKGGGKPLSMKLVIDQDETSNSGS